MLPQPQGRIGPNSYHSGCRTLGYEFHVHSNDTLSTCWGRRASNMCSRLRHGIGPGHDRRGLFHLRGEEDCVDCCAWRACVARQGPRGRWMISCLSSSNGPWKQTAISGTAGGVELVHPDEPDSGAASMHIMEGAVWPRWTPTFHDSSLFFPCRRVFNIHIHYPEATLEPSRLSPSSTEQTRGQNPRRHDPPIPQSFPSTVQLDFLQFALVTKHRAAGAKAVPSLKIRQFVPWGFTVLHPSIPAE